MSESLTVDEIYGFIKSSDLDPVIKKYYLNRYIEKYYEILMEKCPDQDIFLYSLKQGYQPTSYDLGIIYYGMNRENMFLLMEYYQLECPIPILEDDFYFDYNSDYIHMIPDQHIKDRNGLIARMTLTQPPEIIELWKKRGISYQGVKASMKDIEAHSSNLSFLDSLGVVYDKRLINITKYIGKRIHIDELTDDDIDLIETNLFYRNPDIIDDYLEITDGYINPHTLLRVCWNIKSFDKINPDVWTNELIEQICQTWPDNQCNYLHMVVYLLRHKKIFMENLTPPHGDSFNMMLIISNTLNLDILAEFYEYTHREWYEWFRKYLVKCANLDFFTKDSKRIFKYLQLLIRLHHDHPCDPTDKKHEKIIKLLKRFHLMPVDVKQNLHSACVQGDIDQVKKLCAKKRRIKM